MGVIFGIDLYHENYFSEHKELSALTSPVFVTALEEKLQEAIGNHTKYQTERVGPNTIHFLVRNPQAGQAFRCDFNTMTIKSYTEEGSTTIKSQYFTPKLYYLLARLALSGHGVVIDFRGQTPFYTPETIKNYNGQGNYCYVLPLKATDIPAYISQLATTYRHYESYWELCCFWENAGILYFDNHTRNYVDGQYNIFMCFNKGNNDSGHNLSLEQCVEKIGKLMEPLSEETGPTIAAFQPIHKPYYNIQVRIDRLYDVKELADGYMNNNIEDTNRHTLFYETEFIRKNEARIQSFYNETTDTYDSIVITDSDLKKGHIYLDKLFDEEMFDFLGRFIASYFCPCSVGSDISESKVIYYTNEEDKAALTKIFEPHLKELPFDELIFIKVGTEQSII